MDKMGLGEKDIRQAPKVDEVDEQDTGEAGAGYLV
jgi:hypothetical protein